MRVLFIGTGDIGLPSLRWLINTPKHQVVAVVTQPDKPVGRKLILTPPATKTLALKHSIPVLQPLKIRNALDELRPLQADIAIVVAYGQILSRAVLDIPRLGCLNIHASILPRHRGAAPIQAAIREGDPESGVTIMYMDEGLDTGDILHITRTPLTESDTGASLHDRLADLAPAALEHALDLLSAGTAPRTPQDNTHATHIGKLTRTHGRIDWTQPATHIARTIRAYHPWPGTHTHLASTHLKIFSAVPHPEITSCPLPGTVLDNQEKLLIACGIGALELTEVQLEGSKRLPPPLAPRGPPPPRHPPHLTRGASRWLASPKVPRLSQACESPAHKPKTPIHPPLILRSHLTITTGKNKPNTRDRKRIKITVSLAYLRLRKLQTKTSPPQPNPIPPTQHQRYP